MKKLIMVYNITLEETELICSVTVDVQKDKINTTERIQISFEGVKYEVAYIVGMDYGIVVPKLSYITEVEDFNELH